MTVNPRDALDKARAAAHAGEFAEALEQYDYFFEHALDDDPYSLYGVRLSYCLIEWARLGEKYPKALERLEQKKASALELLQKTRAPERFHDYIALCENLGCKEECVPQFLNYHSTDPDLAGEIVRFIWEDLVAAQLWNVCAAYLSDAAQKYEVILMKFDVAMRICSEDPSLGDVRFETQTRDRYIRDVINLLLVLKNNMRFDEAVSILESVQSDMQSRNYPDIPGYVRERAGLQPAG